MTAASRVGAALLYEQLLALRDEYLKKMIEASDRAQQAQALDELDDAAIPSTESERYREACYAVTRAIALVEVSATSVSSAWRIT